MGGFFIDDGIGSIIRAVRRESRRSVCRNSPEITSSASSFVTLEQLRGERFIVREPESATRALSEERIFRRCTDWRFRLQVNRIDAIKASVAEGIGISFISRRAIDRELKAGTLTVVPVRAVDLRRPICMLSNPRGFTSNVATGLATYTSQRVSF